MAALVLSTLHDNILSLGEITVASPSALARETTPMIVIRLTAIDNGGTRLASTVPITVILSNINDFSPVFSSPSYSMSIPEVCITIKEKQFMICNFYPQNSQAGVSIITIVATDGDGDTVTYTIASGRINSIDIILYTW